MAEVSAQTQAIIDRLKAEGDLVRNSGTNSIRSVNVNLEKLTPLFDAISTNVAMQTEHLQRQVSLNEDALERQRNKEQFEEIKPSVVEEKDTKSDKDDVKPLSEVGNEFGDKLAKLFSLKNIAMAAAGGFVGFNLLKGFVDEKYNGAFTQTLEGLGALGPKLGLFAKSFDPEKLRTDFEAMTTNITSISTALTGLDNTINDIKTDFDEFAANPIGQTAGFILNNIGALGLAIYGGTFFFKKLLKELKDGTKPVGGVPWWRRALGLGAADPVIRTPGGAPGYMGQSTNLTNVDDVARLRQDIEANKAQNPNARGRGNYGMDTAENRARLRQGYADSAAGRARGARFNPKMQRVTATTPGGGNTIVSDADMVKELEASLKPRYAKIYNSLTKILKIAKPAFALVELIRILMILTNDDMDDDAKMIALAPILGEMVGGLGGAALGAVIGGMAGPWTALIGGIGGGILGAFGGNKLGEYIVKWAFDIEPDKIVESEVSQVRGINPYEGMSQQDYVDMANSMSGAGVAPSPDFMKYMDPNYNPANDPSSPSYRPSGGGRGRSNYVERPGERAEYQGMIEQMRKDGITVPGSRSAIRNGLSMIESGNNNNNTTIINAQTIAPSPTTINQGGSNLQQISYSMGGGGGVGPSVLPYGLTGQFS